MRKMLFFLCMLMTVIACEKENTSSVFNPNLSYGTVKDIDGNSYKTIQIGTQTWMAENLRTTKYRNGKPILNITDNTQWYNNITGAWVYYDNNAKNNKPYGKLYNWYAVKNTNQLCPMGWHVPTYTELRTLISFLDPTAPYNGANNAGGKMKSTGNQYWVSPNTGATNSSGFSGLPVGKREFNGLFNHIGRYCNMWSSTEWDTCCSAWFLQLDLGSGAAYIGNGGYKTYGFCVRCIKD
jgi:uncharacterized protein (TIGR02145 family)